MNFVYFTAQTRAKISQFKIMLQNIKKGSLTMKEYISKVKSVHLTLVGYVTSDTYHMEAILNGLPADYDTFIVSLNSKSQAYTIEDIESLLLAHEARIEKHTRILDSSSHSINLATQRNLSRSRNRGGSSNSYSSNHQQNINKFQNNK